MVQRVRVMRQQQIHRCGGGRQPTGGGGGSDSRARAPAAAAAAAPLWGNSRCSRPCFSPRGPVPRSPRLSLATPSHTASAVLPARQHHLQAEMVGGLLDGIVHAPPGVGQYTQPYTQRETRHRSGCGGQRRCRSAGQGCRWRRREGGAACVCAPPPSPAGRAAPPTHTAAQPTARWPRLWWPSAAPVPHHSWSTTTAGESHL
jgi:hypothetical protein